MLYRAVCADRYAQLAPDLADRLEALASAVPRRPSIPESDIDMLAEEAAKQWTGKFNPRPFDAAAARDVYRTAR
jgi:alcohol dehydrogenase class IV